MHPETKAQIKRESEMTWADVAQQQFDESQRKRKEWSDSLPEPTAVLGEKGFFPHDGGVMVAERTFSGEWYPYSTRQYSPEFIAALNKTLAPPQSDPSPTSPKAAEESPREP